MLCFIGLVYPALRGRSLIYLIWPPNMVARLVLPLLALCALNLAVAFSPNAGMILRNPTAAFSARIGGLRTRGGLTAPMAMSAEPKEKRTRREPEPEVQVEIEESTEVVPVVTSKFVGDQVLEDKFVNELDYWKNVMQEIETEFKEFKSAQEVRLKDAQIKLEAAQDKKESLSFIPFLNLDKDIDKAQEEVHPKPITISQSFHSNISRNISSCVVLGLFADK
jgi:hypothetical protein